MTNTPNPNFHGNCYAADDLATLQAAAPVGVFYTDEISGDVHTHFGQITKTKGWLVEPVYGEPDPETGDPVILTPGTRPPAACLLTPPNKPIPALEAYRVAPLGWQGFA